jgi:hypothetical protein
METLYWILLIVLAILGYYFYSKQDTFTGYKIDAFTNGYGKTFDGYLMDAFTNDNRIVERKQIIKKNEDEFMKFTKEYNDSIDKLYFDKKNTIGDLAKKKINDEINKRNSDYNNRKRQYYIEKEKLERDLKDLMIKENLTDSSKNEPYVVNERDKINWYISQNPSSRPPPQKFVGLKQGAAIVDIRGPPSKLMNQLINDESMGKNPFAPNQVNEFTRLDVIAGSSGLTSGNLNKQFKN